VAAADVVIEAIDRPETCQQRFSVRYLTGIVVLMEVP